MNELRSSNARIKMLMSYYCTFFLPPPLTTSPARRRALIFNHESRVDLAELLPYCEPSPPDHDNNDPVTLVI